MHCPIQVHPIAVKISIIGKIDRGETQNKREVGNDKADVDVSPLHKKKKKKKRKRQPS